MADFYRHGLGDTWATVKGAARLLVAPIDEAFPSGISDIIEVASGATQYDAKGNWTDLGATKTGVNVSTNHTEETLDVDQIMGDIASDPVNWECSVSTALAEVTLEHLQLAWEGGDIDDSSVPGERSMGFGQSAHYTKRRLAVLFKNPDDLIRAIVFRKVQLQPVESSIAFNKTGDQQTIPLQFKGLADTTVEEPKERFLKIFEQVDE